MKHNERSDQSEYCEDVEGYEGIEVAWQFRDCELRVKFHGMVLSRVYFT